MRCQHHEALAAGSPLLLLLLLLLLYGVFTLSADSSADHGREAGQPRQLEHGLARAGHETWRVCALGGRA